MRPTTTKPISLLIWSTLPILPHALCYNPDSTPTDNTAERPCSSDPSSPFSAICCGLNRTNPTGGNRSDLAWESETIDICLSNGLCENRFVWEGDGTKEHGVNPNGTVQMTPCDGTATSEKWCCGMDDSCCLKVWAVNLPQLGFSSCSLPDETAPVGSTVASTTSCSINVTSW
ncbi:hypothetical protein K458DRAFT_431103 [Lentithecium fluviatile CBS 122367]|uniref:Hydrophobin n=1 Tax=Lentithecium fluviatile CBS 122367 TaxID=1168545 RepID=A0A6G1J3M5_9PLEO|nr:hypothetical protein K458DRAFT_431103 [Lentithecium fluviatile CBS 122367]